MSTFKKIIVIVNIVLGSGILGTSIGILVEVGRARERMETMSERLIAAESFIAYLTMQGVVTRDEWIDFQVNFATFKGKWEAEHE